MTDKQTIMNTEQQLRERAEEMLIKHNANPSEGESIKERVIIPAMIELVKQELQRIGEVVYVPCDRKDAEYFLDNEGDLLPVKKLSLLEVKDLVTGEK